MRQRRHLGYVRRVPAPCAFCPARRQRAPQRAAVDADRAPIGTGCGRAGRRGVTRRYIARTRLRWGRSARRRLKWRRRWLWSPRGTGGRLGPARETRRRLRTHRRTVRRLRTARWLERLTTCRSVALDCRGQPHGSDWPAPWNGNATAVNLNAGKLEFSDQSGRELNARVTKLRIGHRFPRPARKDAQQTGLLIIQRWIHICRDARSAFVRLHVHVPDLRRRELALVHLPPIMDTPN